MKGDSEGGRRNIATLADETLADASRRERVFSKERLFMREDARSSSVWQDRHPIANRKALSAPDDARTWTRRSRGGLARRDGGPTAPERAYVRERRCFGKARGEEKTRIDDDAARSVTKRQLVRGEPPESINTPRWELIRRLPEQKPPLIRGDRVQDGCSRLRRRGQI